MIIFYLQSTLYRYENTVKKMLQKGIFTIFYLTLNSVKIIIENRYI